MSKDLFLDHSVFFFFFLSQIDECKHVQKLENININVILKNIKISNKYIKILNIN